jgi:hypothetical protein
MATAPPSPMTRLPTAMAPQRRRALIAGALYLLTFVSVPTLALYGPVRKDGYIVGAGPDTGHRRGVP